MENPEIIFRAVERLIITISVPLLIVIGYKLFLLGATGKIQIAANTKDGSAIKLSNLTPGAFCFFLGVILGGYIIFCGLEINKEGLSIKFLGKTNPQSAPLSTMVKELYADAALRVQDSLSKGKSISEIKNNFEQIDAKLKKRPNKVILDDLIIAEKEAMKGNLGAKKEIQQFKKDFIK